MTAGSAVICRNQASRQSNRRFIDCERSPDIFDSVGMNHRESGGQVLAQRSSRAYKLKLSPQGIGLFLDCHCRLTHLVNDFLPYGTTLFVAVAVLERASIDDLLGEVSSPELPDYGGKELRFVGASPALGQATARIVDKIVGSAQLHPVPPTWKLYIAALNWLRSCEDQVLIRAYQEITRGAE